MGLLVSYTLQAKTTLTVRNATAYKVFRNIVIGTNTYKHTGYFGTLEPHSGSNTHQADGAPNSVVWRHVSKKKEIQISDITCAIEGDDKDILLSQTIEQKGKDYYTVKKYAHGIMGLKNDNKNWTIICASKDVTVRTKRDAPVMPNKVKGLKTRL